MKVVIDADLVLELLINRQGIIGEAEEIWNLVQSQKIEGFITNAGLEKIYFFCRELTDEHLADEMLGSLEKVLSSCSLDQRIIRKARLSTLKDFESAIESTCAKYMGFDGVVTHCLQNFSGSDSNVWSVHELLAVIKNNIKTQEIYQNEKLLKSSSVDVVSDNGNVEKGWDIDNFLEFKSFIESTNEDVLDSSKVQNLPSLYEGAYYEKGTSDNLISPTIDSLRLPTQKVLDFPITALRFEDQIQIIMIWAIARESRTVCIANVHMLMEAHSNPVFAGVLQNADVVTPDGMPLVWMMRKMGARYQDRIAGMDILQALCQLAQIQNVSVFFLGSQTEILSRMRKRLEQEFPKLKIAAMEPLPFRPLTENEDAELINKVNSSGAGLVFVSLDCPKQENWMAQHKGKIQAVMLGMGEVFPVYAGIHKHAPRIIRELGFEWLYRWIPEPRHLWSRYATTILLFIWLATKQLMSSNSVQNSKYSEDNIS